MLEIISGIWRPLEADPGGQSGTDLEVTCNMHSCMSKYRFVRVRISILKSTKIFDIYLEAVKRLILEASQEQKGR